ncbi:CPBP family intramembrane metalloprotease [Maribius pontilimi]|uniref:CPBP family intramembrane metalloprotease n=1 Tax=Palleronia pontilimi TaxID=1964209 RepID=A0A934M8Q5_9RHOB|nr:CPBP family intramembrane glutamic endopeptidase [Palleronia pontilimi]MBJ3761672.1 CPBP family intramembrane metalloprotease [Palleronia pontilimi]
MAQSPSFDAFVAPARARPQLWRLLLGLVVCVAVMALWIGATFGVLVAAMGFDPAARMLAELSDPTNPRGTLLLLSTFAGMFVAPIVAARLLQKRRAGTLFGSAPVVVRHFAISVGIAAVIYGLTLAIWSVNFDGVQNLSLGMWLALLPLSLLAVVIQTGAEEVLFRGYLMQQLAARFASPLVHMLVPAFLFGILHYDPGTMGSNAWAVVGSTAFFGLIAADLTVATGSIGAAWGLHFANNVVAILLISTKDTITGLALYTTPYTASEVTITGPLLMADLALIIAVWACLRWVFRR